MQLKYIQSIREYIYKLFPIYISIWLKRLYIFMIKISFTTAPIYVFPRYINYNKFILFFGYIFTYLPILSKLLVPQTFNMHWLIMQVYVYQDNTSRFLYSITNIFYQYKIIKYITIYIKKFFTSIYICNKYIYKLLWYNTLRKSYYMQYLLNNTYILQFITKRKENNLLNINYNTTTNNNISDIISQYTLKCPINKKNIYMDTLDDVYQKTILRDTKDYSQEYFNNTLQLGYFNTINKKKNYIPFDLLKLLKGCKEGDITITTICSIQLSYQQEYIYLKNYNLSQFIDETLLYHSIIANTIQTGEISFVNNDLTLAAAISVSSSIIVMVFLILPFLLRYYNLFPHRYLLPAPVPPPSLFVSSKPLVSPVPLIPSSSINIVSQSDNTIPWYSIWIDRLIELFPILSIPLIVYPSIFLIIGMFILFIYFFILYSIYTYLLVLGTEPLSWFLQRFLQKIDPQIQNESNNTISWIIILDKCIFSLRIWQLQYCLIIMIVGIIITSRTHKNPSYAINLFNIIIAFYSALKIVPKYILLQQKKQLFYFNFKNIISKKRLSKRQISHIQNKNMILSQPLSSSVVTPTVPLIILRKFYHLLIFFLLYPPQLLDREFVSLALSAASGIFVLIEQLRAPRLRLLFINVGEYLDKFLSKFTDQRDSGIWIKTHQYLLIGCAIPIWLSHILSDSIHNPIILQFSGILVLGLGDTFATIVGLRFRGIRWYNTKKTLSGTLGGILSMYIGTFIIILTNIVYVTLQKIFQEQNTLLYEYSLYQFTTNDTASIYRVSTILQIINNIYKRKISINDILYINFYIISQFPTKFLQMLYHLCCLQDISTIIYFSYCVITIMILEAVSTHIDNLYLPIYFSGNILLLEVFSENLCTRCLRNLTTTSIL